MPPGRSSRAPGRPRWAAILGAAIPLALALDRAWQFAVLGLAAVALLALRRGVVAVLLAAAALGVVAVLLGGGQPG